MNQDQNKQEYINIVDIFEYFSMNLHTLPVLQRNIIASNIAELQYIDKLIARENGQKTFEGVMKLMADEIKAKTMPVDILQMSAFIYKGRKAGYNVEALEEAMNQNGEWLMQEQVKTMRLDQFKNLNTIQ